MDLSIEANRLLYMLERLCKDVSAGKKKCPESELLTAALRTLFPEDYFPPGTGVAVKDSVQSSWYIDVGTEVLPPNRDDVRQLRRELTKYIKV
jgi:hypothetical protein